MTTKAGVSFIDTAPMATRPPHDKRSPRHHTLVLHLASHVERVALQPDRPVVIGREPPADIVVCSPAVSRRHARLTLVDGQVLVEDLGSRNGTHVGSDRLDRALIAVGQEIALGDVVASVQAHANEETLPGGFDRHDVFVALLDHELRSTRFFGGTGAVVFLQVARGRDTTYRRLCAQLPNLLRPVDRVALYSAEGIEVLLPDATIGQAVDFARRARAIDPDSASVLAGVAAFPVIAGLAEDVVAQAREAARDGTSAQDVGVFAPVATTTWSAAPGRRFVVESPGLAGTLDLARRVARAAIPVLLLGETGTGKEIIARYLHDNSARAAKPLVAVNCAAIPRELLESTLFGHEKGAFTGAIQSRRGVFEAADKGTVLLDEIGELPPGAQAALLRVLETKRITRVGATDETPVDVRIVAATHRNLDAMCAQGTFREDLMFRLNTMVIEIPPLRERRGDIRPLAEHFFRAAAHENGRSLLGIEESALALLTSYAWPGNARELRNAIERAVVVAPGDWIGAEDLPDPVRRARPIATPTAHPGPQPEADLPSRPEAPTAERHTPEQGISGASALRDAMDRHEEDLLRRALAEAGWSVSEAARRLDLPLRTLQHKLKRYSIRRTG